MNIAWFSELHKEDINIAGGKAASLSEMYNVGLPIPPGFIVTAQAFKNFLKLAKLDKKIYSLLQNLDVEDNEALQETAKEIQDLILKANMPEDIKNDTIEAYDNLNVDKSLFENAKGALEIIKAGRDMPFVAVRSSATAEDLPEASFAGQQATFLNVKGNNNLINSVKKCWASLYTARAIYYRVKNNFPHEKVLIAVIVQRQINSKASGVIFSVNPVTNNENEILIEAGFGLGEAVVGGQINPDQYLVDKETLEIKDKKIAIKEFQYTLDVNLMKTVKRNLPEDMKDDPVLNDYEISKLAELTNKIEQHYGKPQDIEYAIEGSNIYIVQSRPITTLKKPVKEEIMEGDKEVLISGLSASPGIATGTVKIIHDVNELDKVQQRDILVTEMTNPDFVPAMKRAIAIVTNSGGVTAHAAIVSREMGIPCIVGTNDATSVLKDNDIITVDAYKGNVYKGEVKIEHEEAEEYEEDVETVTEIKVIMDLPDFAENAAKTNADGVGLLRLEMMIAENGIHPSYYVKEGKEDEYINLLYNGIKKIALAFQNKAVWVRTSDMRSDEYKNLQGFEDPEEDNPMMGWHGIRRSLDQPEILKAEFKAIKKLHDDGLKNVGVMIPFIINTEELRKAKSLMREIGLEPLKDIETGVMIETPASSGIIEGLCKEGINFVSFGTNDLTQLTLGIDRNNEKLANLYDEMHPAILKQIKEVVKICKDYNVKTSICGQAGSRPEMAEFLVNIGIGSIAANPDAVAKIRHIVARTEKKLLLEAARKE